MYYARLFRVGLTVAALSFGAAAQDADPSVDEIIAKSIEARGGLEKLRAIQSSKSTGKMALMGGQIEAPFTLIIKRPSFVNMTIDLPGKSLVRAFDGSTAWTINPMLGTDDPQKMSEAETRDMTDNSDVDGPLVDYKAKGHAVELVGKEDVNGKPAYKLKIVKKSGKTDYTYIDAKTFLAVKGLNTVTGQGREVEVESYPSDYRAVNGVMIPFALEQKMNGESILTMTVDKVEANGPVDAGKFKMPAPPEKKESK